MKDMPGAFVPWVNLNLHLPTPQPPHLPTPHILFLFFWKVPSTAFFKEMEEQEVESLQLIMYFWIYKTVDQEQRGGIQSKRALNYSQPQTDQVALFSQCGDAFNKWAKTFQLLGRIALDSRVVCTLLQWTTLIMKTHICLLGWKQIGEKRLHWALQCEANSCSDSNLLVRAWCSGTRTPDLIELCLPSQWQMPREFLLCSWIVLYSFTVWAFECGFDIFWQMTEVCYTQRNIR